MKLKSRLEQRLTGLSKAGVITRRMTDTPEAAPRESPLSQRIRLSFLPTFSLNLPDILDRIRIQLVGFPDANHIISIMSGVDSTDRPLTLL